MSSAKKCPSCNTKITWWRRSQHIRCNHCDACLVMANYTTFYLQLIVVPFVFTLLWSFNPLLMAVAIIFELAFHYWFIANMLFYKVVDEQ